MRPKEKITRANRLSLEGLHDEAAELLAELLRCEPSNIQAHYALAQVRVKQGHKDWAESLLRRARWLEDVISGETDGNGFLKDDENSDLAYAEAVESEILIVAREFDEWEHDHPKLEIGKPAISLSPDISAVSAGAETICQPAQEEKPEPESTSEPETLQLQEELDSEPELLERPLLSLSFKRSGNEEGGDVDDSSDGPTIIWKGRRHATQHEADAHGGAWEDEGIIAHPPVEPTVRHERLDESDSYMPDQEPEDEEDMTDLFSHLDMLHGSIADLEAEPENWQEVDIEDLRQNDNAQPEDAFAWSEIEVDFSDLDDEEEEYIDEDVKSGKEPTLPGIPERIELWRRTEQLALELLRQTDRLDNPRARHELRILSRVLLEGAAGARRPDISVNIRSRHLGKMLVNDVSVDEIAAAHACRQAWAENPELHIDLGGFVRGEGWARKEEVRHLFPWSMALRMVELFRATEIEEFRYIFASMHERWSDKWSLQLQFPLFRLYVHFRLRPAGLELDRFPLGVFDEPEGVDFVERWEDDPVEGVTFRQALESNDLLPDLYRTFLDLPVLKRNEEGDANDAQWC